MNASKQQYLNSIRADSAYPVYRGVIGTIALLGYALAGVCALLALVSGFGAMGSSFITGVGIILLGAVVAGIIFLSAKLSKEAALILADLADSTVETNSRAHV